MALGLDNIRQAEGLLDELSEVKYKIEQRINLKEYTENIRPVTLKGNKIMRICLLVGLNSPEERTLDNLERIQLSKVSTRIPSSFFTLNDFKAVYSALLKLRYKNVAVDWENDPLVSRIINAEIFRGRDLYSFTMANALCAIDSAKISANMSNRLSEAIINAYKANDATPITFEAILNNYVKLQSDKDKDKDDSVKSVFKQLIRTNLFTNEDQIDLIKDCYVIKMDAFPKDGPIAKAIVYFVISKLNLIYEKLPKQAVNDECVELRHFTIIDEAHYMLGFDNKPLRDLIAIGRNKGLSIILATQNMDSYKSDYFDFYANAQYPLIMKQQSINDVVIKDLFGVSGKEFQEIKEAIAGLQKGELIIKDTMALVLGMGKKYKKIKVTHLI